MLEPDLLKRGGREEGAGVADADFDELGHAFAIADDHLGEFEHDLVQSAAEQLGLGRVLANRRHVGLAVAHHDDGVVRAGVAVDGDAVVVVEEDEVVEPEKVRAELVRMVVPAIL